MSAATLSPTPLKALIVYLPHISTLQRPASLETVLSTTPTPHLDRIAQEGASGEVYFEPNRNQYKCNHEVRRLLELLGVVYELKDGVFHVNATLGQMYKNIKFACVTNSSSTHDAFKQHMPTLFNDCSLLPSSIFRTDNTTTFDPVSASTQIYSHLNQVMSQNDIVILHCSDRPFSEPTSGKESSVTPIERKTDLLKVVDLVVDMIFRDEEVQARKWSWQDCFKVFVAGWDDKGNLEEIENAYENVQKSTTQELGIQDEAVVEMLKVLKPTPSHRMKDGKQVQVERVPCTAFYHHIPSVRRDTCNKFNEWEVSQRGGNLGIGSWHFMKEIGFKMGAVDKYGA